MCLNYNSSLWTIKAVFITLLMKLIPITILSACYLYLNWKYMLQCHRQGKQDWYFVMLLNCLARIITARWNLYDLISLSGKEPVSMVKETTIQLCQLTGLTSQLIVGNALTFLSLIPGIGGLMERRPGGKIGFSSYVFYWKT